MDDRYLWDGTGPEDPEVARLEALLRPYRHRGGSLRVPRRGRIPVRVFAAAAALLAGAVAVWVARSLAPPAWRVQTLAGTPSVGTRRAGPDARLAVGQWLQTDGTSRARVAVARIGRVDVEPNSRVRLVSSTLRQQRLELTRGEISAVISAPPRLFSVDTPSGTAVDLGCEYRLSVAEDGAGRLSVSRGWVELAWGGREAIVPAGYRCATRPGRGPGTPRADSASRELVAALDDFDFGAVDAAALPAILTVAGPQDGLSLWHLLSRTQGEDRARVYDALARLVPPPAGVTREGALRLDAGMLALWRFEMGTPLPPTSLSFWRALKARLTR